MRPLGTRARAGVVVVFVFAAGVAAGVVVERHRAVRAPASTSPEEEHEAALAELREVLELDEDQIARVHEIVLARQQVVQRMWEQLRPGLQSEMRQVHVEIAELLRPEQRERFHEWLMERAGEHGPATLIRRERER